MTTKNLFEELQAKKELLGAFAKTALEKGWIKQDVYDGIMTKLEQDTLTIGVIGQMKCGKSTFLNAFIFGEDILPAATTPMTAALSVITYGEKEEVTAEFYTPDEWAELQMQSERNLEEVENDPIESSKIKAARELVSKSQSIGNIRSLLGKTRSDNLKNLVEYVGADGKYVAITKSVTIHYPKEWLKGVEIVDTPGFNDPVVSREVRTQEFLKKADAVLLLLYAGRAFDATDRDIVFEKVRSVGVGKILIGVNKYDLCYEKGETEEEIIENVSAEIKKACREYRDSSVSELIRDEKPVLFSASMALMAKMPMEQIRRNEDYDFHWKRTCDIFEISTQREMLAKSLIANLEDAVRGMIEKSKGDILFRKPVNMISQAVINAKEELDKKLGEKKETLRMLELPDDELQDRIDNLDKAQRRIERRIERIEEGLSDQFDEKVKDLIHKLEDLTDDIKKEIHRIIDTEAKSSIERSVKWKWENFTEREVPRVMEKAQKGFSGLIVDTAEELINEATDVINKYVDNPEDLIESFSITIRKKVKEIRDESGGFDFAFDSAGTSKGDDSSAWSLLLMIPALPLLPFIGLFDRLNMRNDFHDKMDRMFAEFDLAGECRPRLEGSKQKYIELLNAESAKSIIANLSQELEKSMKSKEEKERQIELLRGEVETLAAEQKSFEGQMEEMKKLKSQII